MTAMTAQLKRGAATQALTVTDNIVFPDLASGLTVIGGGGPADPVVVREVIGPVTTMSVPLTVSASTQALLATALDALDAFVRGGVCTLEVTFPGSATATIWDVYGGQPTQPLYSLAVDVGHVAQFSLQLQVSPFARKAVVALYTDEHKDAPCTVDLSSMTTNYRTPLTISIGSQAADDLHSCYVAVDPTSYSATITNYVKDAKDLTWSAGETDTADAAARIDNAGKFKTATYSTAPIDTSAMPEGAYLLLARVKVANASYAGTITTDYTDDEISYANTTWCIVELGTCHIPVRKTRASTASNLTVSVKSADATTGHESWLDWVAFVPLDWGMFSWHPATATTDCTTVHRDAALGITYVDNIADGQYDNGVTLMASGGALLVVSENAEGDERVHPLHVSVSYYPRYAYMR